MNKLTKFCIVLLPLGFITSCIGGVIMGVSEEVDSYDLDDIAEEYIETTMPAAEEVPDEDDNEFGGGNSILNATQNEASSIVVNCTTAANINLYKNDEYSVSSDYGGSPEFSAKLEDGTIFVDYKKEKLTDNEPSDINIGIPRNCQSIKINLNYGNVSVAEIMCSSLEIITNYGDVSINDLIASESAYINSTLGYVYVYGSQINNFKTELVSGNLNVYSTVLSGKNTANINVGDASFSFDGFPSDYTIRTNVTVGELDCEYDLSNYNNSENTIDVTILAGDCSIEFND